MRCRVFFRIFFKCKFCQSAGFCLKFGVIFVVFILLVPHTFASFCCNHRTPARCNKLSGKYSTVDSLPLSLDRLSKSSTSSLPISQTKYPHSVFEWKIKTRAPRVHSNCYFLRVVSNNILHLIVVDADDSSSQWVNEIRFISVGY